MDTQAYPKTFERLLTFAIFLALLSIGLALLGHAYTGSFMRYSGDDYCYGGILTEHGFSGGQAYAYLNPVPFHGNRYSLTFFAFFFGLFPPMVNGLLPVMAIILWTIGLVLVVQKIASSTSTKTLINESWLMAGFLVFVSLYTAPDLPQSLYWRSSMLPYLAPVIGNIFLVVITLINQGKSRNSYVALIALFALSILSGGFSEAVAAIQIGIVAVWLFIILLGKSGNYQEVPRISIPVAIAFLGSVFAIAILLISPSTQPEVSESGLLSNLIQNAVISTRYANDFIIGSLKGLPLPHAITLILFFVLSVRTFSRSNPTVGQERMLPIVLIFAIALCYLLISMGMAPSVFVRGYYPNPRALIAPRFILMVTVAVIGWVFGFYFSRYLSWSSLGAKILVLMAAVVFVGVSLYSLRVAYQTFRSAPRYQIWASLWDDRDERIRADLENGARDLEVVQIEKIFQWVAELSPDPRSWYNACAAEYYGARSISASLAVQDDP